MRVRRLKIPVLSRLTWAWFCFVALCGVGVVYSVFDNGRTRAAVAMAVEGIERLAPPAEPKKVASDLERFQREQEALAPTFAADALRQPELLEAEDALSGIEDPYLPREDAAADVIITVDGAPARAIGSARAKAVTPWTPVAAPDAELLKRTAYGSVPRVAADGRKPSKFYAQQFTPGDKRPVALIVGGLGINRALTERAIDELPPQVTLAFAPYAKDLTFWTKRARDAGHEIMIEIPMENRTGDEEALGPAALLTTRTAEENAQRLDWILSRFSGYFGVTNYLGAKFSGDRDAMEALLARIDTAGLAYVDDTGALSRARVVGEATTVNRLIDPGYGPDKGQSQRDLQSLEKIAAADGDALGKTYVHDETLTAISDWASSLDERGFALAPASAVLAMRAGDR
ncbi:MAG: divergent polysaccharide deacetylase family protein [Pseudomonadota bacterium]